MNDLNEISYSAQSLNARRIGDRARWITSKNDARPDQQRIGG
jgi:hypothetical protein